MQLLSTAALLGLLSAVGPTDASPCKDRPGHHHHHHSGLPPVPTRNSTVTAEASQEVTPTTPTAVQITPSTVTSSTTVTSGSVVSSSVTSASTSSLASPTAAETPVSSALSSSSAASTASSTVVSVVSTASASASAAASAVPILNAPAQNQLCGDDQEQLLTEWGLVVSNFRVEESSVEGTVCTTYNGMVTLPNGQTAVEFTADANLVFEEATINDNKFYSNAGLGKNIPSQLSSIASIPASYSWSRTNTTDFRGNVVFDLVLAPTSGDRTSSATKEVMMWLHVQGGQLPLAWNNGTKATFDLYGTTWDMYQGINYNIGSGSGVELTTIVPAQDFGATGSWSGDIKDWLDALATQGVFTDDYYVTNANAGTEQYWGDSVLVSTVALEVNLN